jgi:hypothetical protein
LELKGSSNSWFLIVIPAKAEEPFNSEAGQSILIVRSSQDQNGSRLDQPFGCWKLPG